METSVYVKFFDRAFEKCVRDLLKMKNENITCEDLKGIKGIAISTTDSSAFSIPWQADASAFNMCIPNLIFNVNKSENNLWIKDLVLFKHIKSLHIYVETEDLSFVQELKDLKELYVVNTRSTVWNFIKNLTKLEYLCVQNSEFKDLNIIAKLCEEQEAIEKSYRGNPNNNNYMFYPRLDHLYLVNCGIENLEPLRNCNSLIDLNLSRNNVTNMEPLKDIECLYYLTLRYNQIENIESFEAMKGLYYLNLRHNKIKDISIFSNKENYSLSRLFLDYNPIEDYTPLKGWDFVASDVRYEDKLLERAIKLAEKYHEGQFDKGGHPYVEHPLRVMDGVESTDEKVVAVLHDVLEDCDVSREQLIKEGIPDYLVNKLEILCKGKNEKYFDYIDRIKDPLTLKVKLSDLKDNMNLDRLKEVTEKDLKRLEKYKKAKKILEEKEPYLFLDFDFTCTYMNGVKDGLSEFLEFCLENFNVYWCSYADYSHILDELEDNISNDLLYKIIYKEVEGKSKIEFIYNIIGDSKNFVYIDDDISALDYSMLENAKLLNNFIKAVNNKYDLKRIREELENMIIN